MLSDDLAVEPLIDAILAGRPPLGATATALARAGVTRLDVWSRMAERWIAAVGPEQAAEVFLPACFHHALEAPDPDAAAIALSRLDELTGGVVLANRIASDPRFGRDLLYLLGFGVWTAEALVRDPGLVDVVTDRVKTARAAETAELQAELDRRLRGLQAPEHRLDALRRWKREQFLGVIFRDRLLHLPQRQVTFEISTVADVATRAALALAAEEVLGLSAGAPCPPGLALVAMGKWGSQELNYNSDVDLLCVWEPGSGPTADAWTQVVQRLTAYLAETTNEGRLFRVDHRLRPEGDAGPLVRSLESYDAYYATIGESWEAQALTRARACAGDGSLGRRFEALASRVAYGTRLGRAGVSLIRRNRERLDGRDRDGRNIKEGRGGIRDIEFCCQLLQLVRGVTDPSVRQRNTWQALDALAEAGALTERERRTLAEAYDFLRQVEHLLQLQPPAPTKLLPTEPRAMRRLGRAMGFRRSGPLTAGDRFLDALQSHTTAARELCQRLFWNPIPFSSPNAEGEIAELLDPLQTGDEVLEHLAAIEFGDAAEARRRLLFLAHGEPPMRLPPEVQALFVEFLPALLTCIQRMPDPDASLRWFERFVSRAGGREPLYRFLVEHPPVLEVLCRIGGFSEFLAQTIADYPEYLNHVVNPSFLTADLTAEELCEELAERLRPLRKPELRFEDLRRFRRREAFRTGVRDLLEVIDTERVVGDLSRLADLLCGSLLAELRATVPGTSELPFAVIGCGKLGGRELHYSSDLDVLFVYEPGALDSQAPVLAERLARAMVRESEARTAAGRLYELDARLRPHGGNSPLCRSLAGYAKYYETQGQAWERLAMTRVRHIAGDADVGRRFVALAHRFAFDGGLDEHTLGELRQVKQRIERERRDVADAEHIDVKLEPGGLMDIEFAAQILQLRHGAAHPGVRRASTPAALAALAEADALPVETAAMLQRAYWSFRRLETRLQLVVERSSSLLPLDPAGLAAAAKRLGWAERDAANPQQLVADVRERMRLVREAYVRLVGVAE